MKARLQPGRGCGWQSSHVVCRTAHRPGWKPGLLSKVWESKGDPGKASRMARLGNRRDGLGRRRGLCFGGLGARSASGGGGLLADPDRFGSDLEVLIVAQPLDRLLQAQSARRLETDGLV